MTYDNYGNILTKNGAQYVYGDGKWKDKLTAVDGRSITYDDQGNPIKYLGHTLTWEKGRQLKSFDDKTYTYNANGIRTSKTVDDIQHKFILDGAKILREVWGDNYITPLYDNEDTVCGIIYNNNAYYFLKNLQGDIVTITDKNGETVAKYTYDAWGVPTIVLDKSEIGIATINPFRYRGYYYDQEICLYYLQSRYYNPEVARFVNGDEVEVLALNKSLDTINLFVYCNNNPVNNIDTFGCATFRDLWNAIKNSFSFIKSIADQAYYAFDASPPMKKIKKLSKQSGKSQRQIIRELKQVAADSKKCFKAFKIAGIVMSIISAIVFVVSYLKQGKNLFNDIYRLIVDLFVDAFNWLICKIVEVACKFIPAVGLIVGFAASWVLGVIISAFFTNYRKTKITKVYSNKMRNSKKWYDWFKNLFLSLPAAF